MSIRSMSDEQLAARHDLEPWLGPNGVRMIFIHPASDKALSGDWTFAPRVECIPSRDPLPFLTGLGGRCAGPSFRFFNATAPGYFSPRREFRRPPVNPILSAFRDLPEIDVWLWAFASYDAFGGRVIWNDPASDFHAFTIATSEQVADARKVLERFARVAGVSN